MLEFAFVVIGMVIMYVVIRFIPAIRKFLLPPISELQIPPKLELKLLKRVKTLHEALFSPIGMNVAALFNDVWKEAGVQQKGIPNIRDGRVG